MTAPQRPNRIAVVDIGSNTVKLSVYACRDGEAPAGLHHEADTVRIGYRVSATGKIASERLDRLMECLGRYERQARELGASEFIAVATQAFRIASNTAEVMDRIERETSWRVRVIDATEETALTIEGARPWLIPGEANVVADIGGASTEVISVSPDGAIAGSGSVAIGSGLMFDEEIGASPPPHGSLLRVREKSVALLDGTGFLTDDTGNLLLPGGTGHYLELLLRSIDPALELAPANLHLVHEWLAHRHAIETMERIPVQIDRAQVLPASLAIVEALVLRLCPLRIVAIPSGIRDGIARRFCSLA